MISWTCPHCGAGMYSSWDRRDEEIVICIACEGAFKNPYYRLDVKGAVKTLEHEKDTG